MINRLVGKDLIKQSLLELLEHKPIDEITVTEIAKNCGISTRAFYNHFDDKHQAVGSIYLTYMEQYLDCALDKWYEHMGEFFDSHPQYMKNTLCYRGQNNIGDVIIDLEWIKLRRHILPEVYKNKTELMRTEIAIEYMLYGNIGSTRNSLVHKKQSALGNYMQETYGGIWEYLSANIPPLVLKNLSMLPVDHGPGEVK